MFYVCNIVENIAGDPVYLKLGKHSGDNFNQLLNYFYQWFYTKI